MSIRQRRLDKGWSQSQLAEFCGLSLRTVQRIEKGQKPTMESLKALASVFETGISDLVPDNTVDESCLTEPELEELKQIKKMKAFFLELFTFFLVVPLLCLSNWMFAPDKVWAGLTALGWGTWLAFKAFDVFEASDLLGGRWEKRQLEKRLRRKVR